MFSMSTIYWEVLNIDCFAWVTADLDILCVLGLCSPNPDYSIDKCY